MDFFAQVLLFSVTIAASVILANSRDISVIGIEENEIQLRCDLPISEDAAVEWLDRVWGSDEHPERIFQSKNNPDFEILSSHPNHENYQVDSEFTLTISKLDMNNDVGQYLCRSQVGDIVHKKHYYLTVGELPKCVGHVQLRSGNETSLSCEMAYSGHQPTLEWYEDDNLMESTDEYDIRMAKKVVNVHATHKQDGTKFTCRMTLGTTKHVCSLTMNVTYAVHQPKFHQEKEKFKAGEEVKCSAKGNPTPMVTLTPNFPSAVSGNGWVEFIVDPSWEGQQMSVQCTASNKLDGIEHTKSTNFSFHVSVPHKRLQHHQHHHSTVAMVLPDDKENNNLEPVPHKRPQHHQHHHSTVAMVLPDDKENHNLEPADQHSEHMKKDSTSNQKEVKPPSNPDVKPVKSDNSAGTLVQLQCSAIVLCLLITALWM